MRRNDDASDLVQAVDLASRAIAFDTRSSRSNSELADLLEYELDGFELERLDFPGAEGVQKSALVAFRDGAERPFLAFAAHMDTVPPGSWRRDPFVPLIEEGRLYGLGSCDMKGPLAAAIVAARGLAEEHPIMLLLTCDEETTKEGARRIVSASKVLAARPPAGIIVVEPTGLVPLRGHRVDIQFVATALGVQAHSSTPFGLNANINLIPFLAEMRELYFRLRSDPTLQDAAYSPPWCDLNIIVDNHGTATNVTPEVATCRIKFRYSKAIDPEWVVERVMHSAGSHNLKLAICPEGTPPELPLDDPLVRLAATISASSPEVGAFGSDASQFATVAPTIVMGPGSMLQAHAPEEFIELEELGRSIGMLRSMAKEAARANSSR